MVESTSMARRNPPDAPVRRGRGRPRKDALTAEQTKDRLLVAAEEAFVELGYEGVTINEIVGRAGYTPGAVYNHFGGKAELLIEVVRRVLDRVAEVVQAASTTDDITKRGAAMVEAWFSLSRADRLTLGEVNQAASRHERVRVLLNEAVGDAVQATQSYIEDAQATGRANPDLDAGRVARIILVFCAGLNHLDTVDLRMSDDQLTRAYVVEWINQLHWVSVTKPAAKRRRQPQRTQVDTGSLPR